jgi:hypothetical protein
VTSRPASADWAGTIRSTAVLAKTALAATAGHSGSGTFERMCSASVSVALMAFSHAITARGAAPSGRLRSPAAITGATNFRTVGPTAVVTMSAEAISSTTAGSSRRLLSAR